MNKKYCHSSGNRLTNKLVLRMCLTESFRVNIPNLYHVNKISYRMISLLILHCQLPVLKHVNT